MGSHRPDLGYRAPAAAPQSPRRRRWTARLGLASPAAARGRETERRALGCDRPARRPPPLGSPALLPFRGDGRKCTSPATSRRRQRVQPTSPAPVSAAASVAREGRPWATGGEAAAQFASHLPHGRSGRCERAETCRSRPPLRFVPSPVSLSSDSLITDLLTA